MRSLDPPHSDVSQRRGQSLQVCLDLGKESLALAAEWRVYLKSAQELKYSDRDLAPSKQENPGVDFDVLAF